MERQQNAFVEEGRSSPPQSSGTGSQWARAVATISLGFVLALSAVAVTDSVRDDGATDSSATPPAGISDAADGLAPKADDANPEMVQARGCWFTCWRR